MTVFEEWLGRKLARRACPIREPRTVEETFAKARGPRGDFAAVRMTREPGATFEYLCEAQWPEDPDRYNSAVVDGLLDELLATDLGPVALNVRFTLHAIQWHDVDSSPRAFYFAARAAARRIVGREEFPGNVIWG
jgi:hypothetical protein